MDDVQNEHYNDDRRHRAVEDDEINLLDYFRVIYKYRRMIVLICAVAVIATAVISFLLPEIYAATASVVPPIEILEKEVDLGADLWIGKKSILGKAIDVTSVAEIYVGILESRATLDTIIDRFDLMKAYKVRQYKSDARKKLRKNTTIKATDEGIVAVTVEDRSPKRAAAMANAYIEELDRQNKRLSSGQATSKKVFLEHRLEEIEQDLSNIENMPAREATIKEMLYELLTRQCELAKIEEARSMPTVQTLDEAVVPERKSKPRRMLMVALSAVTSSFVAVLAAFAREFFARLKMAEAEREFGLPSEPGQTTDDGDFADVEDRRRIVAMQRKKRAAEEKSYVQET